MAGGLSIFECRMASAERGLRNVAEEHSCLNSDLCLLFSGRCCLSSNFLMFLRTDTYFSPNPLMRILSAVAFVIAVSFPSFAQVGTSGLNQAESLGKSVYGLGFSAGAASGIGLSFRTHLPSKSSFQGVFGIIKTTAKLSMSVGAEYQHDLTRGSSNRFFFVGALGYFYSGYSKNDLTGPFRLGAGLGSEFNVKDAVHVTIQGMFVYFSNGTVLPLPQASLHYYFF